ncbi:BTAD domain-containing putative transcriptional regulator [Streptomyces sp. NPDC093249]|uniref:BTAD domain-containing putative transcriptional regulator n=1 Tax=unclassified Streptomyces TaxID=2593676 RepID=UPI0037FBBABE
MRFQLLGPLSITDGRAVAVLPPSKPTALLAALLVRPGSIVSAERLRGFVWGEEHPPTAKTALQSCVLRLRRLFAKYGIENQAVVAVAGGYRIDADTDTLDLLHFRRLVEGAAVPDAGAELFALRTALGLWQGALLSNVPSDLLHRDEVPRLAEERLRVLERVCDIELEHGRYREALVDLWEVTRVYPAHERFAEQLMVALYRTGRQTEALAEYRRIKGHLRERLGVDPRAALQRLEMSILRGEDLGPLDTARGTLTLTPPRRTASPSPSPHGPSAVEAAGAAESTHPTHPTGSTDSTGLWTGPPPIPSSSTSEPPSTRLADQLAVPPSPCPSLPSPLPPPTPGSAPPSGAPSAPPLPDPRPASPAGTPSPHPGNPASDPVPSASTSMPAKHLEGKPPALGSPLTTTATAMTGEHPTAPLPAVPHFTGRESEVAALLALLESDRSAEEAERLPLAVLSGAPGIGKTALALHIAHRTARRFRGGCVLLSLTDPDGTPRRVEEAAAELRRALPRGADGERGRALLVLDDVVHPDQVRPLLTAHAGGAALVTSRMGLAGLVATHGGTVHRLGALEPEQARALLTAVLGPARFTAEPAAARTLAAVCGHHPLALRIAAARLLTRPRMRAGDYAEWLRHDPVGRLSLADDVRMSVPRRFDEALGRLSPGLAEAHLRLAASPYEPLTAARSAEALGLPVDAAEEVVERLLDAGFLEEGQPGAFWTHELLRAHARRTAGTASGHLTAPLRPPRYGELPPAGRPETVRATATTT